MALVGIERRLGRLPARVPDGIAVLDVVVASVLIERRIVITVTGQTQKFCVLVEAVSAAGIGNHAGFHPIAMEKHNEETQMTDFVPKPLYTKKQLQEFRQKNIVDGRFVTDEQTIQSVEDLEKLLFLWQEETDDTKQEETVHIDGELKGEYGFVFSKLVIDAKKGEKK